MQWGGGGGGTENLSLTRGGVGGKKENFQEHPCLRPPTSYTVVINKPPINVAGKASLLCKASLLSIVFCMRASLLAVIE
jgi:hypothetical protein